MPINTKRNMITDPFIVVFIDGWQNLIKIFCLAMFVIHSSLTFAESWPNWLGPNYSGALEDVIISIPSGNKEYTQVWSQKVGEGWSAPVVADGRVILHDRSEETERVHCMEVNSGRQLWTYSFASNYRDDFGMSAGPRSTPAVGRGVVVTHSPSGIVCGIRLLDGKLIWKRDLVQDFQSPKGFFGRCSSPLIIKDKVIFAVGGSKAGLVSFSLKDGSTYWKSKPREADYASCIPYEGEGGTLVLSFLRDGFLVVDAKTGEEKFFSKIRSPIKASVKAATPLVIGRQVFVSACYEVGASLWKLDSNQAMKSEVNLDLVWKDQGIMDCHYSTPVEYKGYLFGFHGRQERGSSLRCIEVASGEIKWEYRGLGCGNLLRLGDKLVVLSESGELLILPASPESFEVLFRQQVLGTCRAYFAYYKGFILLRDNRRVSCLRVKN